MIIRHVDPSSYGWGVDAAGPVENASGILGIWVQSV